LPLSSGRLPTTRYEHQPAPREPDLNDGAGQDRKDDTMVHRNSQDRWRALRLSMQGRRRTHLVVAVIGFLLSVTVGNAQLRALPGIDEVTIDVLGLPPNRRFTLYATRGNDTIALLSATSNNMGVIPEALAFVAFSCSSMVLAVYPHGRTTVPSLIEQLATHQSPLL
ncbi:MAG TPA: hypothetical protein VFN75_10300, partial [Pseudonocardiaceae bacterium]|nr:hypothetical protein [Pseudonocardiaceae bacterium]